MPEPEEDEESTIEDLRDVVELLRQKCLKESERDYYAPRRFYVEADDVIDYMGLIIDMLPRLTKQLLMIRRFSNILGASREVYAVLWQLRSHLLKHALAVRLDENGDVYFLGNLEFGFQKFSILKHKMLREFDTILEALEDYPEVQRYVQRPDIDEQKIYIIWKEPKHLQGMLRGGRGLGDIVYVNADTPLGSILTDYFGIYKLPAVVYPAGGIVQQGVTSLSVVASTIAANVRQDAYIESDLFRESLGVIRSSQQELRDLLEKVIRSGEESVDVKAYFKILRSLRRALFHVKKILWYEVGRFARGNTDLFAPVGVLAYVIEDEINEYHIRAGYYEPDVVSLIVTTLATTMTRGIMEFLDEFRPSDITPATELVVFVGHKECPFCAAVKQALEQHGLLGIVDDVQIDCFDALGNELVGANFLQYVVREGESIDQTLPSPMAFYALNVTIPTADLPKTFNALSPELYSKLRKRLRLAQARAKAKARATKATRTGAGKDKWDAIIDYHARTVGEREEDEEEVSWRVGKRRITLKHAVVFLREMGMKWKDIETVIALFFGRHIQYTVLQKIYRKALEEGVALGEAEGAEEAEIEYDYEK